MRKRRWLSREEQEQEQGGGAWVGVAQESFLWDRERERKRLRGALLSIPHKHKPLSLALGPLPLHVKTFWKRSCHPYFTSHRLPSLAANCPPESTEAAEPKSTSRNKRSLSYSDCQKMPALRAGAYGANGQKGSGNFCSRLLLQTSFEGPIHSLSWTWH